jgi:hypothetical protein
MAWSDLSGKEEGGAVALRCQSATRRPPVRCHAGGAGRGRDDSAGLASPRSYLPVNSSAADMDVLAAPVDAGAGAGGVGIHFAGEATCRLLYGTVHAAPPPRPPAGSETLDAFLSGVWIRRPTVGFPYECYEGPPDPGLRLS